MPQGNVTLLDVVKLNGASQRELIEEDAKIAPEVDIFPLDQNTEGDKITLKVRTDLPGSAGFRKLNKGGQPRKSLYEIREFQAYRLDDYVDIDEGILAKKTNPGAFLAQESAGVVISQLRKVASQIWYGTVTGNGGDANGFMGLMEQALPDTTHVIDATGTTAGQKTSVWLLRLGVNSCAMISDDGIAMPDQFKPWDLEDSDGGIFPGFRGWVKGSCGLYLGNKNHAVRIKNITQQTDKKLTDTLLSQAVTAFKKNSGGLLPTHIFMNSQTHQDWWSERVTTEIVNPDWPMDFRGIPVVDTESIISGEVG